MIERAGHTGRQKANCVAWASLLGLAVCTSPLLARPRPGTEAAATAELVEAAPAQQNISPQPTISLQEAVEIATRSYPGRVVRAETKTYQGGRAIHEIRILGADSRVRTVRIDAQGGELR